MPSSRSLGSSVLIPVVIGAIGLVNLMNRPRFAAFHTVDVLQLLGSGMCFGIALAALVVILRGKRSS